MVVGVIAEYNPFHNGHAFHLKKIKEMYPESTIVLITNGMFSQRGEISVYSKWDKTAIALSLGIDLVIELPFPFATQSADFFAKGAIQLLDAIKVDVLVFGSECNDINLLKRAALIQKETFFQKQIKENIQKGMNYPTALARTLNTYHISIQEPNDILGVCYIKEIQNQSSKIEAICIQRTNSYHEINYENPVCNASNIRALLKNRQSVHAFVPEVVLPYLEQITFIEQYFPFLKYKIISEGKNLVRFQGVEEGIENRIKKYILISNSLEEFVKKVKTKRYTYNKIMRMCVHILCGFTKEEAKRMQDISYIRILGFTKKGRKHLKSIKKDCKYPIITNFSDLKNNEMLQLEMRTTAIYASIFNEEEKQKKIEEEYKHSVIQKD